MGTQSTMKRLSRAKLLLLLAAPTDGYIMPFSEARPFSNDNSLFSKGGVLNDRTEIGTISVPSVGIGTIAWSSDSFTSLESQELEKLVATACRSNAAFFDTAERYGSHTKTMVGLGYGETEKLMQLMLSRAREAQGEPDFPPIVATKFTPTPWRTTAQSVVDACEMSCKNLGVDQIDLYQIHMPDIVHPLRFLGQDKPKDSIYWDGLADCYHRGLVKNVGCSNYGPTLVAQCQEALAKRGVPLASNQIGYSILGRHNGAQDTVDKCNELGVKVLAYFPFAMGLLTGKYSSSNSGETDTQNDGSLSKFKRSSLELKDLQRYAKGDGITIPKGGISPLLLTMESIAETRGKSVAQVALNYIISKGVIPIPGARTVQQVEDNIGAMGWRLTETEVAMLELESDKLGFDFDGAGFKRTGEKFVGYGTEKFSLN